MKAMRSRWTQSEVNNLIINTGCVFTHVFILYSCVGSACNSTAVLIPERHALDNQQPGGRSGSTTPIQENDGQVGELVAPKCDAVPVPNHVPSQLDEVD